WERENGGSGCIRSYEQHSIDNQQRRMAWSKREQINWPGGKMTEATSPPPPDDRRLHHHQHHLTEATPPPTPDDKRLHHHQHQMTEGYITTNTR
ncbi:hypothetical protein Hamer_G031148, partial [Homarus americanus]